MKTAIISGAAHGLTAGGLVIVLSLPFQSDSLSVIRAATVGCLCCLLAIAIKVVFSEK